MSFLNHLRQTAKHTKTNIKNATRRVKNFFTRRKSKKNVPINVPSTNSSTSNFPIPLGNVQGPAPLPRHLIRSTEPPINNNQNSTNPNKVSSSSELPNTTQDPSVINDVHEKIIQLINERHNYKYSFNGFIIHLKMYLLRIDIIFYDKEYDNYLCINKKSEYKNFDEIVDTIYTCIQEINKEPGREKEYINSIKNGLIYAYNKVFSNRRGGYKHKKKTQRCRNKRKQRK